MSSHDCAPPCPLPACLPACLPASPGEFPSERPRRIFPDELFNTCARSLAFRPLVSTVAADEAGAAGPRRDRGLEADKSHSHLRQTPSTAPATTATAQDLQQFSNQSSEQFDGGGGSGGGGGGGVHPTREHEGHGLEVSMHFDSVFRT